MSSVDKEGMLIDPKVTIKRFKSIEHGELKDIHAIVVHQTDAPTAKHTFNAYLAGGNGTYFLVDKTGIIYTQSTSRCRFQQVDKW